MSAEEIRTALGRVLDEISKIRASAGAVVYSAGLMMTEDDSSDSMSNDLRYGLTNLWDLIDERFGKVEKDIVAVIDMIR